MFCIRVFVPYGTFYVNFNSHLAFLKNALKKSNGHSYICEMTHTCIKPCLIINVLIGYLYCV